MDRRPRRARRAVLLAAISVLVVVATVRVVMVNRADETPPDADAPVATVTKPAEPATTPAARPQPPARNETLAARIEPRETATSTGPTVPSARQAAPPVATTPGPGPGTGPVAEGLALAQRNKPVQARGVLTQGLRDGTLDAADAEFVRETLQSLNRRLVFSPQIAPDDPFARAHVVAPGEQLGGIVRDRLLDVDWRFIVRINNMRSGRHLRAGQRLKLVTGPFHAVVDKSDYRMDLYMGSGDAVVYVTSLAVGLGAHDSTPLGRFRVRGGSRLENPAWANPRTGEQFGRDDPENPIGEYWIGLEGVDDATRDMDGYGIHGTIEPDSIGRQASMGCVRLLPDDVKLVFEVLTGTSTVEIVP